MCRMAPRCGRELLMTKCFALQDAIAEQVVQALSLKLSKEDKTRLVKHHTQSTRAYQLYLKGRYYWWKNSPQEYIKSRDDFHRAVEEDPSYALGYCGLNSFYGYGAAWGIMPPDEGWPKAEWQLRRPSNSMTSSLKHTSIWLHSRWFTT